MCFLKKHSHQNHKWTASGEVWCCWTNRDHFGDEHKPCTAREHSPWIAKLQGSLEKANSFSDPQGGNDSERRDSYPGPTIFPGEQTFSVKHCSIGWGSPVTDLSREPNLLPGFWQNEIAWEKAFILQMLGPSSSQLLAAVEDFVCPLRARQVHWPAFVLFLTIFSFSEVMRRYTASFKNSTVALRTHTLHSFSKGWNPAPSSRQLYLEVSAQAYRHI